MSALLSVAADRERAQRWGSVRRVLAVRLDNLGDVLMTTPALAAIHRSVPLAQLTLLASPAGAAVARHVPLIDEVLEFAAPWVKGPGATVVPGAEAELVACLAAQAFDAAVVFTVCTQSALPAALLCRMAGIPLRLAHSRENPYGLLTDWVPETDQVRDGMRHEVARQLALVERVGWRVEDDRLFLATNESERSAVRTRLHAAGIAPHRPYFVVHPGASAASRRYPATRFGLAADEIARRSGCTAVFTGDAAEHDLIEQARGAMRNPSVSMAGLLDLGELAALIAGARLVIANNTGPAHIAAAMGTPVVVLYALTNPQHTPWRVPARVLSHVVGCRWCLKSVCPEGHHDCLNRVEPDVVVGAALALLSAGAGVRVAAPAQDPVAVESGPLA